MTPSPYELRDLIIESRTDIKHMSVKIDDFLDCFEKRVAAVDARLDCLEHDAIELKATVNAVTRMGQILAGFVAAIGVVAGIVATVFWVR